MHGMFGHRRNGFIDVSGVYILPNLLTCLASTLACFLTAARLLFQALRWLLQSMSDSPQPRTGSSVTEPTKTGSPSKGKAGGKEGGSKRTDTDFVFFVLLLGWLFHVAPYLTVHREMFIIYYCFGYYFAVLNLAASIDHLCFRLR